MRRYLAAITIAFVVPCTGLAQLIHISTLESGARIRITAATIPDGETIGRLHSFSADSIHFLPDAVQIKRSVALQNVRTLEVSRPGTRKSEYATLGALAGGIIGYISSNHGGTGLGTGKTDASQNAVVGAFAGIAIGGALGWWYGGKRKVERWQQVYH